MKIMFKKYKKPMLIDLNFENATGECVAGSIPTGGNNACTSGTSAAHNCDSGSSAKKSCGDGNNFG